MNRSHDLGEHSPSVSNESPLSHRQNRRRISFSDGNSQQKASWDQSANQQRKSAKKRRATTSQTRTRPVSSLSGRQISGQQSNRPQTAHPSNLTTSLVQTIVNDFDASKAMNDDLEKIMPLQISPAVLSNYTFRSHSSMLRLLKYGSDLSIPPKSMQKQDNPSRGTSGGAHTRPKTATSTYSSSTKKSTINRGPDLSEILDDGIETIDVQDPNYRRQVRERMMKERYGHSYMQDQPPSTPTKSIFDDTHSQFNERTSVVSAHSNTRPVTRDRSFGESAFQSQPLDWGEDDEEGKEKEGGGDAQNILKLARNANQRQQQQQLPTNKQDSVFAPLFSDPTRRASRNMFSPFSSKTIPFFDASGGDKKDKAKSDVKVQYLPDEFEDNSDDDYGDDEEAGAVDPRVVSRAREKARKRKEKREQLARAIAEDERLDKEQQAQKKALTTGKTVSQKTRVTRKPEFRQEQPKRSQSASSRPLQVSEQAVTANLYASPIRNRLQGVLMGHDPEEEGWVGYGKGEEVVDPLATGDRVPIEVLREQEESKLLEKYGDTFYATAMRSRGYDPMSTSQTRTRSLSTHTPNINSPRFGQTRKSPQKSPHKKRPLIVTRLMEPSNTRAVGEVKHQREIEDATLAKYVHIGIAAPPVSVAQYQRFMAETAAEVEGQDQNKVRTKALKRNDALKLFAERDLNDHKYGRQIPADNKFVLEVRKPLISGGKKEGVEEGK
ncbi:hypothetical protein BLNAU_11512 [Blattamonas nauphoetae]|uniref:Uncharacterized protein n=1 Tax=Blattamonas nauphoetae TaxID=2049346 RepID=A0ABQ9XM84_9EUKA|nr:hypothetical protein BLNAU_11512 [Blattamonas nauphoetae]